MLYHLSYLIQFDIADVFLQREGVGDDVGFRPFLAVFARLVSYALLPRIRRHVRLKRQTKNEKKKISKFHISLNLKTVLRDIAIGIVVSYK